MFSENLKNLRISRNVMAKTVADELDMTYRNYQRYENGERDITFSKFVLLANYFDVSLDYLAGRTDNPDSHKL